MLELLEEAQLSQRGRTTLHVVENLAKFQRRTKNWSKIAIFHTSRAFDASIFVEN